MRNKVAAILAGAILGVTPATAHEVKTTPDMTEAKTSIRGTETTIGRIQDTSNILEGDFAKTSRTCPPFCIHPMSAGEGVETVGELDVIEFLQNEVAAGTGLLVDSRIPDWYAKGSIPGAINIPFSTMNASNPYRNEILAALGGVANGDDWDFSGAMELTLFCNGPWCDQSPRAIQNLLSVGYPAEKLHNYRGGMQLWLMLGLTTTQ